MVKGPAVCCFVFASSLLLMIRHSNRFLTCLLGGGDAYSGFSNTPVLCVAFKIRKTENLPHGSGLFVDCSSVCDRNQSRDEISSNKLTEPAHLV